MRTATVREDERKTTGRCVCCGRLEELVTLAEGFHDLGWCDRCEKEKQQPTFELPAVTP